MEAGFLLAACFGAWSAQGKEGVDRAQVEAAGLVVATVDLWFYLRLSLEGPIMKAMFPVPSEANSQPLAALGLPLRSPRTSLMLAELARQRRWDRRQQRLKRQQRRRAWAQVIASGRRFFRRSILPPCPV